MRILRSHIGLLGYKPGFSIYDTDDQKKLVIQCQRELNIDENLITPDAEMISSLGLNSLELADLIVMCEDRFGIVFEDEDLASLITIGDVAAYIEARV